MYLSVTKIAIVLTFVAAVSITIGQFFVEVDTIIYEPSIEPQEIEGLDAAELEDLIASREKDIGYVRYFLYALEIPEMRTLLFLRFLWQWAGMLAVVAIFYIFVRRRTPNQLKKAPASQAGTH